MAASLYSLIPILAAFAGPTLAGPARAAARHDGGTIITLDTPPTITEVVPCFSETETTITEAGVYTLGVGLGCVDLLGLELGCIATVVTVESSSVCTITGVGTSTTTFPCSTATTFTSGSQTYCWQPPTSSCPVVVPSTATVTAVSTLTEADTSTVTAVSTLTEVVTSTSVSTTTTSASCSSTPTPLTCDKHGYLIQARKLFQVDLATGAATTVNSAVGNVGDINAMGYNVLDNFLYGIGATSGTLVRIAVDGTATNVKTGLAVVNVGDVDTNGTFWYSYEGSNWYALDLTPGSPTYLQALGSGTMSNLGYTIADWVYIPVAGPYLWTVGETSSATALLRWSMAAKTWAVVNTFHKIGSDFGAIYGMNNGTGTLYASDNGSGDIYKFPLDGSAPTVVSHGPASSPNDGARCVLNLSV